jgi:hypothetical protein
LQDEDDLLAEMLDIGIGLTCHNYIIVLIG